MSQVDGLFTRGKGLLLETQVVKPAAVNSLLNTVQPGVTQVEVTTVTNDANDWITLPSLATIPNGHTITILCNAGENFEMRTPASSNEKINNVDSDGTQEYLCTDTQVVEVTKMSTSAGWMAHAYTRLGAVATAVIPD